MSILKNIRKDVYFKRVCLITIISTFIFYSLAVLRHYLLQSNAYDLGLFDQWIWLTSKNLPSYSSMTVSIIILGQSPYTSDDEKCINLNPNDS